MSKREIDAVLHVLMDPALEGRPAAEVAEAAIAALDDLRARSRRLAVVGQISYLDQEPQVVVLGPFSTRGNLDSEEKFRRALAGGSAARQAGQGLAWDPTGRASQGRFMLAPAFAKPRDAWDFFRPSKGGLAEGPWNLKLCEERLQRIRASVERWAPGLWGAESTAEGRGGPACTCGLPGERQCRRCGETRSTNCPRHTPEAETHVCEGEE